MYHIQNYLSKIQSSLASGHATEHTYRPALKELFECITTFTVHNEPKRSEHGAPDFIFLDGMIPMMYAEAKDIHISLDKIEKSEQLDRYFGYPKLILTNGIEFRFYNNGIRYREPIVIAKKSGNMLDSFPEKFEVLGKEMQAFISDYIDTIRSARHLAKIMGGKAQRIRDNLRDMMWNTERFPDIWKLYHTFKSEILHDLSHDDFADLYAQTLVYGLFVARYHDQTPEDFTRSEARDLVPKSNPLLRRFFDHIAGEGYEKRLEYIVDELCRVFVHADVHSLMHGMYQKETHDPVIHFYEDFLGEYDSKLRMQRGVFYTPAPVVKFIIRAVDDVLKTHFHLPKGLADTSKIKIEREIQKYDKKGERKTEIIETHRVQILDPATGTGTFLDEIVRHIHEKMKGQAGMWPSYVNADLLPRLHGFELMMASYTIAHLKLGLTLAETGVTDIEKRLQIYLTNSLEEAKGMKEDQGTLFGLLESITDEARQADEVKRDKPVMIVVGNPPYSVSSTNKGKWIQDLLIDYKKGLGEKKINLDDDYIKFIRFGESLIEKNDEGILAYISNNSFIDGITHRQMRKHLMESFDEIYILDLHGSAKKKEMSPDGGTDENVFDIMQGVSINIFIKKNRNSSSKLLAKVYHRDLFGKRELKYEWLESNGLENSPHGGVSEGRGGGFHELQPVEPYYFFVPKDFSEVADYDIGFKLNDIFVNSSCGIKSHRDDFVIAFRKDENHAKVYDLIDEKLADSMLLNKYGLKESVTWNISTARVKIKEESKVSLLLRQIAYRPFDTRSIIYTKSLVERDRSEIMCNYFQENIGIVCTKQVMIENFSHILVSKALTDICFTSANSKESGYNFPLYLYPDGNSATPSLRATPQGGEFPNRVPNLDATIWQKINESVGRETTPEEVLDYIYAVLHSPSYREKYKEFLKIDFPRVPYPDSLVPSTPSPSRGEVREVFDKLVALGGELRGLHLLESPKVEEYITTFPIAGSGEVEKVRYERIPVIARDEAIQTSEIGTVWINETQYFGDVPEIAWNFHIGGYQPAQKWLKDRKGRMLTWEDIAHYQSMIVALTETARVMGEVDKVMEV